MKKIFAILMTVAILCTMSVTAFATTIDTTGSNASAELTVKYSAGSQTDAYAATIAWGSMEFTYTAATKTWNTTDLKWEESNSGAWSAGSDSGAGVVTITNRSSQAITAKFSWNAETDAKGVTGFTVNGSAIVDSGYSIPTADGASSNSAHIGTYTILPTGDYTGTDDTAVKVGTITITLE